MKTVHARDTVSHLLSGKTDNRAYLDHQLLDLTLNTILLEEVLPELDVDFSALKSSCSPLHIAGNVTNSCCLWAQETY